MTTAVDYPTELGRANLVEECTCPTGYTGLSCQVRVTSLCKFIWKNSEKFEHPKKSL